MTMNRGYGLIDVPGMDRLLSGGVEFSAAGSREPDGISGKACFRKHHEISVRISRRVDVSDDPAGGRITIKQRGSALDCGNLHP